MRLSIYVTLGLGVSLGTHAAAQPPCLDPNFGASLNLSDDSVSGPLPLGFTFSGPLGSTTVIRVSSNGIIYTETSDGSGCCDGDVSTMLAGSPRICPAWYDLNPSAGGAVRFNTAPGRAVVTWDDVPEFSNTAGNTFQAQLFADGRIIFSYVTLLPDQDTGHRHHGLVGVSPGRGATDPGEFDHSSLPHDSGGSATAYEFFARGPNGATGPNPDPFDLADLSIEYRPNGEGGWSVTQCGLPPCFEKDFGPPLQMFDDFVNPNNAIGFNFPYGGADYSTISVSSNGFVYLGAGSPNSLCCTGSVPILLSQTAGPIIAPTWTDLNPSAGGSVHLNTFPGRAVVTWNDVPEFAAGNTRYTVQLQLFESGSFVMAFVSFPTPTATTFHDVLVGTSPGGGVADPGESDYSSVPFVGGTTVYELFDTGPETTDLQGRAFLFSPAGTAGVIGYLVEECTSSGTFTPFGSGCPSARPLTMTSGNAPTIGQSWLVNVSNVPITATAGVVLLGVNELNVDLTGFGMEGCTQYTSIESIHVLTITGTTGQASIPVPDNLALVSATGIGQAVVAAPRVNTLGATTSNGARFTIGN